MDNPVILQTFYWEMNTGKYAEEYPEESNLWQLLAERAEDIAEAGFDLLWLPPANKGAGGVDDVGYGTYDLWDLGEFEQKGSKRTKYGTKEELLQAVEELHKYDLKLLYDAVLDHRMGADEKEKVKLKDSSEAEVWTKFNFPGRDNKYSSLKFDWNCFDGTDWNELTEETGEMLFDTKEWDDSFDHDYLMGANLDYQNQAVREDTIKWGKWIINEIGFDGFRFDASKHVDNSMIHDFIEETDKSSDKELFYIGEAWINQADTLIDYLDAIDHPKLHVFDFPLREKFIELMHGNLDMRWLGEKGLVNKEEYKQRAITFIENHDTERDEASEYGTEAISNRKFQAYCYILMRKDGIPKVFWKDYHHFGLKEVIDNLIEARKKFAYGEAYESESNDKNTYSYIRSGDKDHPGSGLVMMITQHENGEIIEKTVNSGSANTVYYDFTGNIEEKVKTDDKANGVFKVKGTAESGYSVWVPLNE